MVFVNHFNRLQSQTDGLRLRRHLTTAGREQDSLMLLRPNRDGGQAEHHHQERGVA